MSLLLDDSNNSITINKWTEKTPSADELIQSTKVKQPRYKDKLALFDGVDDELFGDISAPFITDNCSIFITAGCPHKTGTHILATFYNSGDTANADNYVQFLFIEGKPTVRYGDGVTVEVLQAPAIEDNSDQAVYSFISDGSTREFRKDNNLLASSTVGRVATIDMVRLGANGLGTYGRVAIRGVSYYDTGKQTIDRTAIYDHLRARYLIDAGGPYIDNKSLTFTNVAYNQIQVNWNSAWDDNTSQGGLYYRVYSSPTNNIETVANAELNGTLRGEGDNIDLLLVNGLSAEQLYYWQVVAEDGNGNKEVYNTNAQATSAQPSGTTGFVTVSGTNFQEDGVTFKFAGTNAYYLQVYEGIDSGVVDRFFDAAQAAGITVIRMWAFYDGAPQNSGDVELQTSPGVFNQTGFAQLDRAVAKAKEHGIKVILSLCNYWTQLGGVQQYNEWDGLTNTGPDMQAFINSAQQQTWFKNYISYVLNRVNTVTGLAYKDEPAVFAWEIMNEARNPADSGSGTIIRDWYQDIAQYIKSIDTNHLVTTGEEGFDEGTPAEYTVADYSNTYALRANVGSSYILNTAIPEIDFGQFHWYPSDYGWGVTVDADMITAQEAWLTDHYNIAAADGKPTIIGEYGFPGSGDTRVETVYNNLYATVLAVGLQGTLLWQLAADYVKCYENGGNICYPGGRTDTGLYNDFTAFIASMAGNADVDAPTLSSSTLTISNTTSSGGTVAFTAATDASPILRYELYSSPTNNLNTDPATVKANGVLESFGDNVTQLSFDGYPAGTTRYFNVLVRDAAGNETIYTSLSITTMLDNTPPVVSSSVLALSVVSSSEIDVEHGTATDDQTDQSNIIYRYYHSESNNISSVLDAETNGSLALTVTGGIGAVTRRISGLSPSTPYYINVVAEDSAGNKLAYTTNTATTSASLAPTVNEADAIGQHLTRYYEFYEGSGDVVNNIVGSSTFGDVDGSSGINGLNWVTFDGETCVLLENAVNCIMRIADDTDLQSTGNVTILMRFGYDEANSANNMIFDAGGNPNGFNILQSGWDQNYSFRIGSQSISFELTPLKGDGQLHGLAIGIDQVNETITLVLDGVVVADAVSYGVQTGNLATYLTHWYFGNDTGDHFSTGFQAWFNKWGFADTLLTNTQMINWTNNPDIVLT